ncbi:MAG: TIGR02147 family protein [Oligoflexia bacterium]|nr:TIGR02147 family protein [Oligoflexia bacterium]
MKAPGEELDIYAYLDYRFFLKDWLAHQRASQSGFSLRGLAKAAGLAPAYLSMVLSGARPLSSNASAKLQPLLKLSDSQLAYFGLLVTLGTSQDQETRLRALERMKRFRSYRKKNPRELEVYQYLSRWYYVAIREMASLPDFMADASWIQARLRPHVELKEIREALRFLSENNYIELSKDGGAKPPEKRLECDGGVYRLSLGGFHRQMLSLAADSIEGTPREERSLVGHAFAADPATIEKARAILSEALEKIRNLSSSESSRNSVYFVELALIPFTRSVPVEQSVKQKESV